MGDEAGVARIWFIPFTSAWGKKGLTILGLCHQTTGSSLVCTAVWMTDKTQ